MANEVSAPLSAAQLAQIQAAQSGSMKPKALLGCIQETWNASASGDIRALAPLGGTMPGIVQRFDTCKAGGLVQKMFGGVANGGAKFLENVRQGVTQISNPTEVYGHSNFSHGLGGDQSFVDAHISGAPIVGAPIGGGMSRGGGRVAPARGLSLAQLQHMHDME